MFCSKCGSKNPDEAKFCRSCGAPVTPPAPPASPPQNAYIPPDAGNQAAPAEPQPYPPYRPGGYSPSGGGGMPQPPMPPKKRRTGLIVAIVLLGVVLFATPILILLGLDNLRNGGNTDPTASSNVVLGDGGTPSVSPAGSPAPTGVAADGFRHNYTQILGGGEDVVTLMIYLCGADLESVYGCGTRDIDEILAADIGDNVNVIIETGGCSDWVAPYISDGEVQRWVVEDGELVLLENLGAASMLDTTQLVDFMAFASENYPANRYGVIFWDHGGGSLYGYGSDEIYPDAVLYINEIARAMNASGLTFDFVGFDACLMGSIETAYMLEPYADYLIASEEMEPGNGWDYTPWLDALGDDPSMATVDLGAMIVDTFIRHNEPASENGETTLSVVALREIPYVYETLCAYMDNATAALYNEQLTTISSAVDNTRAFAEGYNLDMIDIIDFVERSSLAGKDELTQALASAVKYTDSSIRNGAYGLSLYFPYTDFSVYGYARDMFSEFGFGDSVYDFYDTFINILAGGQSMSTSRSLKENMTGEEDAGADYSSYDWYDSDIAGGYEYDTIDYTELALQYDDVNGYWYLPLTDEDWDLLTGVEMQILLDDGAGYIDLGSDQYYETDDYGNLILNYGADNTWVALDGQIVCYYAEEVIDTDADAIFVGYVPALLNDTTYIEIVLEWDGAYADGYVAGYRTFDNYSEFGGAGTIGKGLDQFQPGDMVDFICDYYTYDGYFDASYYFGDTIVIGDTLPVVTYEDVGDDPVLECYMLIDIYQNYSWTETIEFSY